MRRGYSASAIYSRRMHLQSSFSFSSHSFRHAPTLKRLAAFAITCAPTLSIASADTTPSFFPALHPSRSTKSFSPFSTLLSSPSSSSILFSAAAASPSFCFYSPQRSQARTLFTNAKQPYGLGTTTTTTTPAWPSSSSSLTGENTFNKTVSKPEDIPSAHELEKQLPSQKQLNDELPSAEELRKALEEGRLDQYAWREEDDEEAENGGKKQK